MARKTIHIADLVALVNEKNKVSTFEPEVRKGWNIFLEDVLDKADVYAGFGYYTANEVPPGYDPGIVRHENGQNEFPDETRVFYYLHRKLRK